MTFQRVAWQGLPLICVAAVTAQADVIVDPDSLGETDVSGSVSGVLANPLNDPLDLTGESLTIGNTAVGTLRIEGSGAVTNAGGFIGSTLGSVGDATVTGNGSTWTNTGELIVGKRGSGTLVINSGGSVTNGDGFIGELAGSTGSVTVTRADSTWVNTGNLYIGGNENGAGGNGTLFLNRNANVAVGGTLTVWDNGNVDQRVSATLLVDDTISSPTTTSVTTIGDTGNGSMLITGGGNVSSAAARFGFKAGSTGDVTVTGSGSTWATGQFIVIGQQGSGTMRIEDGGAVSSGISIIAADRNSVGEVTVTGPGSTWTSTSRLSVGSSGAGTLRIEDGGAVSSASGVFGRFDNSIGDATVTGIGSTWTNTGELVVGERTSGTLLIDSGGVVTNDDGFIGQQAGSTGNVTVTGAGSTWTNTGDLYVGGNENGAGGTGSLTIDDNASVSVADTLLIWGDGTVDFTGGTLTTDTIVHTQGGAFDFTGGALAVTTFQGSLNNQGGTVSPGSSPGTTTVTEDYSQNTLSTLLIEIAGLTAGSEFDQLLVNGAASLDGTLDIDLLNYAPQLGDQFDIIQAASFTGDFATLDLPTLTNGLFFQTEILTDPIGTDIYRINVVPEPTVSALTGIGVLLLGVRRRKQQRHAT